MKINIVNKYFALLGFLVISFSCFSQGNLQFNRVVNKNFTFNIGARGNFAFDTLVVPSGKVLKITATSLSLNNEIYRTFGGGLSSYDVSIDSLIVSAYVYSNQYTQEQLNFQTFWFGSGIHIIKANAGSYADTNYDCVFSLSGIEFNIVP